jgi:hypothetical protein
LHQQQRSTRARVRASLEFGSQTIADLHTGQSDTLSLIVGLQ